jgi:hypothetical protein
MPPSELAKELKHLAAKGNLSAFKKHSQDQKNPAKAKIPKIQTSCFYCKIARAKKNAKILT